MRVVTVVGNPRPASRTRSIADALAAKISARPESEASPPIELCELADQLFRHPSDSVERAMQTVLRADLLVVATPTYKAAYTGLLKGFLDRFWGGALRGIIAVPVMTAEDPRHALAVEFTLRPLLVELGASVPTRGLAFVMSDFERMDAVLDQWVDANFAELSRSTASDSAVRA